MYFCLAISQMLIGKSHCTSGPVIWADNNMTVYKEQTAAVQGSEANSQQHLRFFVETIYGTAFF